MTHEPELRDLEWNHTASKRRVEAAATALAKQWAATPDDVPQLAKVLRNDAWILEDAGLLADPKEDQS